MKPPEAPAGRRAAVRQVAGLFTKLGLIAFGGPAAHLGLMEDEVVRRRQWLTHQEFLDLIGATNLIPGPNSTEMAIHIGYRRAGWPGLVAGGACFILPAMVMVTAIAWAYVRFGKLPQVEGVLYGVKPVIMGVIAQALWSLGCKALKTRWLALLGLAAVVSNVAGVNELVVLFGAGVLMAAGQGALKSSKHHAGLWLALPGKYAGLSVTTALAAGTAAGAAPFSLTALFLFFLKVGTVLFGSGYVLLAFLRADLVERWHWLTENQLLDAVAVGQITPGPLFTTATFIGYLLGGPVAGVLATVGIFLPAFVFVALSGPLLPKLRASATAGAVLDGINAASLALMAVVTWQLGAAALVDWLTVLLAIGSGLLLLKFRVNSAWLVLGGAVIGLMRESLILLRGGG
jgi:chromate transporter